MTDLSANGQSSLRPTATELAFFWFHRVVAAYCLAVGIGYWLRLIGYWDTPELAAYRFDEMAVHWQVASVSLAVLFPFAASGLWMVASWGPVIWFLCAAAETVMHAGFPPLFGENWPVIAVHGLVIVVYLGFRLAIYGQKRV